MKNFYEHVLGRDANIRDIHVHVWRFETRRNSEFSARRPNQKLMETSNTVRNPCLTDHPFTFSSTFLYLFFFFHFQGWPRWVTALKQPSANHLVLTGWCEGTPWKASGEASMGHIRKNISWGGSFLYTQVPFGWGRLVFFLLLGRHACNGHDREHSYGTWIPSFFILLFIYGIIGNKC